ncbi:hypothetical protein bcgnr5372_01830 [Bacillus luti]
MQVRRGNLISGVDSAIHTGEKAIKRRLKKEIFTISFLDLQLTYVFADTKTSIRSLKAQEKLPYTSLHVEAEFLDEQDALEKKVKSSCALHVVSHDNFLNWLELQIEGEVHEGIKN